MKFKSIKGTKDILPDESPRWQAVELTIRSVMHAYNYREIRTPVFEETALFARSIGELTDIVGKEMYTFQDRSGTSVTLKPEMTASVIRSYIQHNLGEQQPLVKVYYIAPMFRQERPQAGRLRQFHQFGAEAIGGQDATVDAEIISLSTAIYEAFGIRNYSLKVNSVGCEDCRPLYKEVLRKYLGKIQKNLSEESQNRLGQNPLRILDAKDEGDRALTKDAPLMKDYLCGKCSAHFFRLQETLSMMKIPFAVDGRIVRGLDYYTKTAFEIVSSDLGSQDALAGGGRYDLLVHELGGKPTPSVGFAAGLERLFMVLDKENSFPNSIVRPFLFIAAADEAGRRWSVEHAMTFRRHGIPCEVDLLGRSLKAQMREADRQQSEYTVIVGEQELKQNEVKLKHMATGDQHTLTLDQLSKELKKLSLSK